MEPRLKRRLKRFTWRVYGLFWKASLKVAFIVLNIYGAIVIGIFKVVCRVEWTIWIVKEASKRSARERRKRKRESSKIVPTLSSATPVRSAESGRWKG